MQGLVNQVVAKLGKQTTPYKNINVSSIPSKVLSEYLVFVRADTADFVKKKYVPNLISYGFLPANYKLDFDPKKMVTPSKTNIKSACGFCPNAV